MTASSIRRPRKTLCPRTRVLASAYAIGAARESVRDLDMDNDGTADTTLYVDGAGGCGGGGGCSDDNDGLTPVTAKKTIGGAVRAIPSVLNADVNVRIAAGIYKEVVVLSSRTRSGQYFVRLIQDTNDPTSDPPSVRIEPPATPPETLARGHRSGRATT